MDPLCVGDVDTAGDGAAGRTWGCQGSSSAGCRHRRQGQLPVVALPGRAVAAVTLLPPWELVRHRVLAGLVPPDTPGTWQEEPHPVGVPRKEWVREPGSRRG